MHATNANNNCHGLCAVSLIFAEIYGRIYSVSDLNRIHESDVSCVLSEWK